jgi:hypothetical protein
MILVDIDKEQMCLKYWGTGVYDYNRAIDWDILKSQDPCQRLHLETKALTMSTEVGKKFQEYFG